MTQSPQIDPRLFAIPRREIGDTRGIVRFTDFSAGYDERKAERYYGDPLTRPTYWDAQNINTWDKPGRAFLSAPWNLIQTDGPDHEYLLYPFNLAVYRFCTANMNAALCQKVVTALGIPSWQALTNIYPGATGVRNAVLWRGSMYFATAENLIRIMSSAEVWTTLAAPAAVTTALCSQVGVGPDDKLMVWWESNGLYSYDGTTWTKLFPATSGVVSSDQYCDLMFMGPGSFIYFTRDITGNVTLRELSVETTGTYNASWFTEPGFKVWPQGGITFEGEAIIVGRSGSHRNRGLMMSKTKFNAPQVIAVLESNEATDGQIGLDFAWRCITTLGSDVALVGGSSRQDRNACMYRLEIDDSGDFINPGPVVSGQGGPIYSIAQLPYAATGASTTQRIFMAINSATYYKDADLDGAPSADCATGFLQLPDIDLGLEDHKRLWADLSAYLLEQSTDGNVQVQFRVDPAKASDAWTVLGDLDGVDGFTHLVAPDDDIYNDEYGTRVRTLQVRLVWTRPTSGTTRDILDTLAVRFAAIFPLGQTS